MQFISFGSIILGLIITLYFSWRLSEYKYKRYYVLGSSIVLHLIYRIIGYIYNILFFDSILASRILVPIMLIFMEMSIVGIFIGVTYLIAMFCNHLINTRRSIGLLFLYILGIITGLSIPKALFYISEYRLYDWLPDYSPVREQFRGGIIIIASIMVFLGLMYVRLSESKLDSKRGVIAFSFIISIVIGIGAQMFEIGIFPDIFMAIFF